MSKWMKATWAAAHLYDTLCKFEKLMDLGIWSSRGECLGHRWPVAHLLPSRIAPLCKEVLAQKNTVTLNRVIHFCWARACNLAKFLLMLNSTHGSYLAPQIGPNRSVQSNSQAVCLQPCKFPGTSITPQILRYWSPFSLKDDQTLL